MTPREQFDRIIQESIALRERLSDLKKTMPPEHSKVVDRPLFFANTLHGSFWSIDRVLAAEEAKKKL